MSPGSMPAAAAGRGLVGRRCTRASASASAGMTHWETPARCVVVVGQADPDQHDRHEDERDDEVHHRAAEHDDQLLGRRQVVEGAGVLAGPDLLGAGLPGVAREPAEPGARRRVAHGGVGRVHADEAHVAAERDRLEAVLGLALGARPQRGAEADHVVAHPDAEALGGHHVPDLVQPDGQQQHHEHDEHSDQVLHRPLRQQPARTREERGLGRLRGGHLASCPWEPPGRAPGHPIGRPGRRPPVGGFRRAILSRARDRH